MGRVIVFIAASLDGFIARPDDDISWLDPYSGSGEDYGFGDLLKRTGTVVMGARSYEQSLLNPERLLRGVKNYVLTHRSLQPAPGIDTEFWQGTLPALMEKIRHESVKDVYIAGGGQVISQFLSEGLVDEICLFIVPVLLNEGIPLYTGIHKEIRLKLTGANSYPSGIVRLRYVPRKGLE
jgi:dihydrofolate reductase